MRRIVALPVSVVDSGEYKGLRKTYLPGDPGQPAGNERPGVDTQTKADLQLSYIVCKLDYTIDIIDLSRKAYIVASICLKPTSSFFKNLNEISAY